MKFLKMALAAGFVALSASTASALPTAKPSQMGAEQTVSVEQVQLRRNYVGQKQRWRSNNNYNNRRFNNNDRRYNKYRGWNRYNSRPNGWRNRGCVAVGPIWFCK